MGNAFRVAVPMTATSKQEPHTPTAAPEHAAPEATVIREVAADEAASTDEADSSGTDPTEPEPDDEPAPGPVKRAGAGAKKVVSAEAKPANPPLQPNNVRKLRQAAMMSKAELARRAGVSPLTIDRVGSGCPCRMDTKRKILEALGLKPEAREQVFGPDIDQG